MLHSKADRRNFTAYAYDMAAAKPSYHVYFAFTENVCRTVQEHT